MKLFKPCVLCLILFSIVAIVPIQHVYAPPPSGWLGGWTWRKPHYINGSTAGVLTDYQIPLTIHRSSGVDVNNTVYIGVNCKSDFSDIRFTNSTHNATFNHWLYNLTGSTAHFWVEIPSIAAAPTETLIYIYFGNPSAGSVSNAIRTGLHSHSDGFNDQSQNTTLWDIWASAGGSIAETAEGLLRCTGSSGSRGYLSVNEFDINNTEVSIYYNNTRLAEGGLSISSGSSDNTHPIATFGFETYYMVLNNQSDRFEVERRTGNVKTTRFLKSWDRPDNYLRMRFNGSHAIFVEGETVQYAEAYGIDSGDYIKYFYFIALRASGYEGSDYFDNFFIRQYVEPEPYSLRSMDSESYETWAFTDLNYRKRCTLVNYESNATNFNLTVNLNFGDETLTTHGFIGSDQNLSSNALSNQVTGTPYTPNASGYINDVTAYLSANPLNNDQNVTAAIYSAYNNESDGYLNPCRLLATTEVYEVDPTFEGWHTFTLNHTLNVGVNMDYWVIIWVNTTTVVGRTTLAFGGSSLFKYSMTSYTFPVFPDPFPKDTVMKQNTGLTIAAYSNLTSETKDAISEVYLSENVQTDFDDIRFTWLNSSQQILCNYWLDPATLNVGVDATVYVMVPELYNNSITYIYLYYGNSSYSSGSGYELTPYVDTVFFDDFDGSAEPPENWDETQIGTSTWLDVTENSYYKVYDFQDDVSQWHGNEINQTVNSPALWAVEYTSTIKCDGSNTPQHASWVRLYDGATEKVRLGFMDGSVSLKGKIYSWITGTDGSEPSNTRYANTTYVFRVEYNGSAVNTYWNGTLQQSKTATVTFNNIVFRAVAGRSTAADNPQSLFQSITVYSYIANVTYAWTPEGFRTRNITFYYQQGIFLVDRVNVVNGSTTVYQYGLTLELINVLNTTFLHGNFTWNTATTENNPYNYTILEHDTIWALAQTPIVIIRYDMFFGGLIIVGCIGALLGYARRRN